MMEVNPCESCTQPCPYLLFIDCPDWLAWAAERDKTETEEGYGKTWLAFRRKPEESASC